MRKSKVHTVFTDKFQLLNSQEITENIIWSCSDSSDYENIRNENLSNKVVTKKRKRKKKVPKNTSNLDITIIDSAKKGKDVDKSPILSCKREKMSATSPILKSSCNVKRRQTKSPIIHSENRNPREIENIKSPILIMKSSPKSSPNVRKKLFPAERANERLNKNRHADIISLDISEIHKINPNSKLKFESKETAQTNNLSNSLNFKTHADLNLNSKKDSVSKTNDKSNDLLEYQSMDCNIIKSNSISDQNDPLSELDTSIPKTSSEALAKKVKSYFDSHFSSENSQHSITNTQTPNDSSKTSEEIEILTLATQTHPNPIKTEIISPITTPKDSYESAELGDVKTKKMKYKKDGLAYRLNDLLKKQTANISLWQHERYLADNSGFILPKDEYSAFRIVKVSFQYGNYLLESIDSDNVKHFIVINSCFVHNNKLVAEVVLKLYEPFKVIDFNADCKLIVNVCKYECAPYK